MTEQNNARARLRQAMREACLADCRALGADAPPADEHFVNRLEKRLWAEQSRLRRRTTIFRTAVAAVMVAVVGASVFFGAETLSAHPEREYTLEYVPQDCIQAHRYTSSDSAYTRWDAPASGTQLVLLQNSVSADALLALTDCDVTSVKVLERTAMLYTKPDYAALTWQMDGYDFTMVCTGSNAAELVLDMAQRLTLRS